MGWTPDELQSRQELRRSCRPSPRCGGLASSRPGQPPDCQCADVPVQFLRAAMGRAGSVHCRRCFLVLARSAGTKEAARAPRRSCFGELPLSEKLRRHKIPANHFASCSQAGDRVRGHRLPRKRLAQGRVRACLSECVPSRACVYIPR